MDQLPTDLLVYIFSFLPMYPRRHCLVHICKRWRSAVYHSVTSWGKRPPDARELELRLSSADVSRLLAQFPRLSALKLICAKEVNLCVLPSTLTRLSMVLDDEVVAEQCFAPPFPAIRRFSYRSLDWELHGLPTALLTACVSSLTSLRIFLPEESELAFFNSTHFPSLVSLAVQGEALPLWKAYASQLTHLHIEAGFAAPFKTEIVHFPKLRCLLLHKCRLRVKELTLVLQNAPQLTELHLYDSDPTDTLISLELVPRELLTSLVTLGSRMRFSSLVSLPRMRHMRHLWLGEDARSLKSEAVQRPVIARLCLAATRDDWEMIAQCRNLIDLAMLPSGGCGYEEHPVSFPLLESVHLAPERNPETLFRTAMLFIKNCPSLRIVRGISIPPETAPNWELIRQLFTDFVHAAMHRRVRLIEVQQVPFEENFTALAERLSRYGWIKITLKLSKR